MPTTVNRRLCRATSAVIFSKGKTRKIVLEINPDANGEGYPNSTFIGLRLAGTRQTYYLPVDWCYREAVKAEIARVKAEKRKAREEKKKLKGK